MTTTINEIIEYNGKVSGVRVEHEGNLYSVLYKRVPPVQFMVYDIVDTNRNRNGYDLRRTDTETENRVLKAITFATLRDAFSGKSKFGNHGLVDHNGPLQYEDVF